MIIYSYILLFFMTWSLGYSMNKDAESVLGTAIGIALYMPLIGRVLGWW